MNSALVDQFLLIVGTSQCCQRRKDDVVGDEKAYLVEKCHVDCSVNVIDKTLRTYEVIFHHPW